MYRLPVHLTLCVTECNQRDGYSRLYKAPETHDLLSCQRAVIVFLAVYTVCLRLRVVVTLNELYVVCSSLYCTSLYDIIARVVNNTGKKYCNIQYQYF